MFATHPTDLKTMDEDMPDGSGAKQVSRTREAAHKCAAGYLHSFAESLKPTDKSSLRPSEGPSSTTGKVHHGIYNSPVLMDFLHIAPGTEPYSKKSFAHETEKTPISINCDLASQANDLHDDNWMIQYLPGPTILENGKIAHSILATRHKKGVRERFTRTDLDDQPYRGAGGTIVSAWEYCRQDPGGPVQTYTGTGATMATVHQRNFFPGSYSGMNTHVTWLGLSAASMQGPVNGRMGDADGDVPIGSEFQQPPVSLAN